MIRLNNISLLPNNCIAGLNRNEKQRVVSNNERLANSTWLSNSLRRDRSRPVPIIGLVHRRRSLVKREDKEKENKPSFQYSTDTETCDNIEIENNELNK